MKKYLPSFLLFLLALLFFIFPELAAILLGGGLLSIAIIYTWFIYRYDQYLKNTSSFRSTSFEKDIFQEGGPTFKTISVRIFQNRKF